MRPADRSMQIDIENKYYVATLTPEKITAVAPDVLKDKPYRMRVKVDDGTTFLCSFVARSTTFRQPTEVVIDRTKKKCVTTNPPANGGP